MEKKSFMDNAKSFLSSWKDDFGKKNEDTLESKKKREDEAEAMKQEMLKTFDELKTDMEGKSKGVAEALTREFAGLSDALKKGTADMTDKLEVENRLNQLKFFLKDAENIGVKNVDKLADLVKEKLSGFGTEFVSQKDSNQETNTNDKTKDNDEVKKKKEGDIDKKSDD